MLNERTADTAVDASPDEQGPFHAVARFRLIAEFLESFPDIPEPYVTVDGRHGGLIGVQIPGRAEEPGERCLAVARITQKGGGVALLHPLGGGWFYEAHLTVGGCQVHVYTPVHRDSVGGAA